MLALHAVAYPEIFNGGSIFQKLTGTQLWLIYFKH